MKLPTDELQARLAEIESRKVDGKFATEEDATHHHRISAIIRLANNFNADPDGYAERLCASEKKKKESKDN